MKPKIIRTEADYESALERIGVLMDLDPDPGTENADELDLLTLLVEHYEEEKFPMDLPDPIEAIKFRMEQQGLKQKDLVPYFGSESKVSDVLSGRRTLSLTMIRNLVDGLQIPAEVLLKKPGASLEDPSFLEQAQKWPLKEMVNRGWFPGFSGGVREARKQLEDLARSFLGSLQPEALVPTLNRQQIRKGKEPDLPALVAWQIRVINEARSALSVDYEPGTINKQFLVDVARLSYLENGPRLAREYLAKKGLPLICEKHLPKTYLDGAAMRTPEGRPVVALTLRYDRLDNFWFTLFHELAHVSLHLDKNGNDAFFDDMEARGTDKLEKEADDLAANTLIPAKEWKRSGLTIESSEEDVRAFAEDLRIHPAIPAGRLRFESGDYTKFKDLVGNRQVRKHFTPQEK